MPPGRLDFVTSWSTMIFAWCFLAQYRQKVRHIIG